MTTPTEAPREALPEPLKAVAWITTRTTDGKKMLEEPCITTNPAYVRVHREWDWRPYGVDHDQAQAALESERQAHAAEVERLRADAERTERNRDMWKGQCERQAEMLTPLRGQMRVLVGLLRECLPPLEVSAGIFESDDAEPLEALIERVATALAAIDQAIARGKT